MIELLKDTLATLDYDYVEDVNICEGKDISLYVKGETLVATSDTDWYVSHMCVPEELPKLISLIGKQPKQLTIFNISNEILVFPDEDKYQHGIVRSMLVLVGLDLVADENDWMAFMVDAETVLYANVDQNTNTVILVSNNYNVGLVRNLIKISKVFNLTVSSELEAFGVDTNGEDVVTFH